MGAIDAQQFYAALAAIIFAIWASGTFLAGADLHRRGLSNPVATVPSCLPTPVLLFVLRRAWLYRLFCHLPVVALLAASRAPDVAALRYAAALSFSCYACCETAVTLSHRDFPAVYALWALALYGDSPTAAGLALGVGIHLMLSSGAAKLTIGGRAWAAPATMRNVLRTYLEHDGPDGPLLRPLAEAAVRSDVAMAVFGGGALFFEVALVPALGLLLPARLRPLVAVGAVLMHAGIACLQSLAIGVAFLVNVPVYAYGFGADFEPFAAAGFPQAAAVVAASAALVLVFGPLPEDWPSTPFALFPWNGDQWAALFDAYVVGDTRLVLSPENDPPRPGKTIVYKKHESDGELCGDEGRPDASRPCCFDAWDQVFGETLAPPPFVTDALATLPLDQHRVCAALDAFLEARTVVAVDGGAPLVSARFARVEPGTAVVAAILADGRTPAPSAKKVAA